MDEILQIFRAALAAADPRLAVGEQLRLHGGCLVAGSQRFDLDAASDIIVIGAGKAAAGMAQGVEEVLGERISAGLLILPRGVQTKLQILAQAQGGHPLPDKEGERATREILSLVEPAGQKALVFCLLSGGASAMLSAPVPGVTLKDKQQTTDLLLQAGATIGELNAVRKHLSRVKGGRLAAAAFPAPILTLALSDVCNDPPDVIGSGPTVADRTTFADAWAVIGKYGLTGGIPVRAREFLHRGLAGRESETLKPGDPRLAHSTFLVIGNNASALAGAREKAGAMGWGVEMSAAPVQGEARIAARSLAATALKAQAGLKGGEKRCLLSGGETTVRVRGKGRGGRNQELALAFALAIAGMPGIQLLSAGTDGADGLSDAAGAVVDGSTVESAARFGLDASAFLADNDSHSFFSELDRRSGTRRHLRTGPTGTNVMDLQVILVSPPTRGEDPDGGAEAGI
jgi:hydroxypyruvate reductase